MHTVTKHAMTGPVGNTEFCSPQPQWNIEGLQETKLTVSDGTSHEINVLIVLLLPFTYSAIFP